MNFIGTSFVKGQGKRLSERPRSMWEDITTDFTQIVCEVELDLSTLRLKISCKPSYCAFLRVQNKV